jgi:hypothetical protein
MRLLLATLIFAGTAWAESPNCTSTLVVPVCWDDDEARVKEAAKVFNATLNKNPIGQHPDLDFASQLSPKGTVISHGHDLVTTKDFDLAMGMAIVAVKIRAFLDPEKTDAMFPVYVTFNKQGDVSIIQGHRALDISTAVVSEHEASARISELLLTKK